MPSTDGIQSSRTVCQGGLNTVNNYLELSLMNPGAATRLVNYESSVFGGYRRINGYTALDDEVDAAGAEGGILGIVGFFNNATNDYEIIVARKQQSGDTYEFYLWTDPGWDKISTGITRDTTDGQMTVRRIRHEVFNFGNTNCIVFVDGVNPALLYDGTDWYELTASGSGTEMSPGGNQLVDKPSVVTSFRGSVFVSGDYTDPSAVCSSASNDPFDWTVASGGQQQRAGFNVVQIKPFRDELYIFGREKIRKSVVNSSDPTSGFIVQDVTNNIGCIAKDSVLEVAGSLIFLAPDGIRPIAGTSRINDVEIASISPSIQDLIIDLDGQYDLDFVNGLVVRKKSQFRYFISDDSGEVADAYGLLGTFRATSQGNPWEFGELMGLRSSACWSGYIGIEEYILHGDYDGIVYRQEQGNTFNGEDISAFFITPYLDFGDTETRKTLHKLNLFLKAEGNVTFDIALRFDWNNSTLLYPPNYNVSTNFMGSLYDDPGTLWDTAVYGGTTSPVITVDVQGSCYSVQYVFLTQGNYSPYTIHGYVSEFSPQGRD